MNQKRLLQPLLIGFHAIGHTMSLAGCNKGKTKHFLFHGLFFGLDLL
jgi:hypothetical protein